MEAIDGIVDIKDDFSDAAPELQVEIDRKRAAAMGIPLEWVATTLRGATAGLDIREFVTSWMFPKNTILNYGLPRKRGPAPACWKKSRCVPTRGNWCP